MAAISCPCVHCTKEAVVLYDSVDTLVTSGSLKDTSVCGGCFLEANGHPKICCAKVTAAGWWDSKEGAYSLRDFKAIYITTATFEKESTSRLLRHRKYPPKTSGTVRLPGLNCDVNSSGLLEHGFMQTERGQAKYRDTLKQIVSDTQRFIEQHGLTRDDLVKLMRAQVPDTKDKNKDEDEDKDKDNPSA